MASKEKFKIWDWCTPAIGSVMNVCATIYRCKNIIHVLTDKYLVT